MVAAIGQLHPIEPSRAARQSKVSGAGLAPAPMDVGHGVKWGGGAEGLTVLVLDPPDLLGVGVR